MTTCPIRTAPPTWRLAQERQWTVTPPTPPVRQQHVTGLLRALTGADSLKPPHSPRRWRSRK